MIDMLYILIFILLLLVLYCLSTNGRRGQPGFEKFRGFLYAHRGLHGKGVPENSMLAFRKAKEAGYGIELDIHLLKDGDLAVIHDSLLKRTTGQEGIVEDLTGEDLQNYFLEDTLETIPLFSQVLELYKGAAPLIVELKCVGNNYDALCRKACQMLDRYNGLYCLESFDPRCVHWLKKNRPDLIRGQLSENYFKTLNCKLPWILKVVLSWQMMNFLVMPDFVAYRFRDRAHPSNWFSRKLWKLHGVSWTLKSQQELDEALADNCLPIFEGFIPQ